MRRRGTEEEKGAGMMEEMDEERKREKEKLGRNEKEEEIGKRLNNVKHSMRHMSTCTYCTRPSLSAGVSSIILVTKIPGSPSMWGLSDPPAMLRPRPPFSPCEGTLDHWLTCNV